MRPDNALTIGYLEKHPDNAARVLESLPYSMTADLFNQLSTDNYLAAFQNLIPSYAAGLINCLQEEVRIALIKKIPHDKIAVLLRFFDESERKELLSQLSLEKKRKIIKQMQFTQNSVGSIMAAPTLTLPIDISVADALKRVKKSMDFHFSDVIAIDKELKYVGMVSLNKLIKTPPQMRLRSVINYKIASVSARKALQGLTESPAWKCVPILPVTDGRGVLIGILDYASLIEYLSFALPEDIHHQTKQLSVMEFFFQVLATIIEALVSKLFIQEKTSIRRGH